MAHPKFRLLAEERERLLADYLPYAETVKIPSRKLQVPVCRDPFDLPFLLLAVVGKTDFLFTGDQDLLALEDRLPCPIVTAEAFLRNLPSSGTAQSS